VAVVSEDQTLADHEALMCAVSGNVPEEPVCTADGYIFEKRLIEKHLEVIVQAPNRICRAASTMDVLDSLHILPLLFPHSNDNMQLVTVMRVHLQETGRHPISGEEFKKDDLIYLKSNKVGYASLACVV
jgi:hypothetical protein